MPAARNSFRVALDVRFTHRPSGGAVYTRQLALALIRQCSGGAFVPVHNRASEPQRDLLAELETLAGRQGPAVALEPYAVGSPCLTLPQHVEFLARRVPADVYHYPHFDAPLQIGGPRLVVTIHDLYPLTLAGYCSRGRRAYFTALTRHNCRRAKRIIAVSHHTARSLRDRLGVAADKIAVIHHGRDEAYRPCDDAGVLEAVARAHGLPERFVLTTGNHKPHKNLAGLLRGCALLPAAWREEFPLVLTGQDRYTDGLRRLACELGIDGEVRWLGHVPAEHLPGLYCLASLYALPSFDEGFGFGALEALACGTAVAAAKAGAIPEVVGEAARLFDPHRPEAIADAIEHAIREDIDDARLREQRLEQAAKFSWAKAARETWDIYREVAAV